MQHRWVTRFCDLYDLGGWPYSNAVTYWCTSPTSDTSSDGQAAAFVDDTYNPSQGDLGLRPAQVDLGLCRDAPYDRRGQDEQHRIDHDPVRNHVASSFDL